MKVSGIRPSTTGIAVERALVKLVAMRAALWAAACARLRRHRRAQGRQREAGVRSRQRADPCRCEGHRGAASWGRARRSPARPRRWRVRVSAQPPIR